jgi:hypothetical protein
MADGITFVEVVVVVFRYMDGRADGDGDGDGDVEGCGLSRYALLSFGMHAS